MCKHCLCCVWDLLFLLFWIVLVFFWAPNKLISLDFFPRCMGITGTRIQVAACVLLLVERDLWRPQKDGFLVHAARKKVRMTCSVHRWDKRVPGSGDSMFSTPHLSEIASRFGTMKQLEVYHSSLLKSSSNKMTWDFYHSVIPTLQEFSSIHWSSLPESHEVFPTFFMAFTLKNSAARSDKAKRKRLSLGNV